MNIIDLKNCSRCSIAKGRRNFVQGRGSIPADLLFIGEAPGKSENLLGEPFVGPSGNLLEYMLKDLSKRLHLKEMISFFITNVILCRPYVTDESSVDYGNNRTPSPNEIINCFPYVIAICKKVNPKFVVFIGAVSEEMFSGEFPLHIKIYHPAFLLKHGGQRSSFYQTDIRLLEEAYKLTMGLK
jgi:DNA polymerase